MADYVGLPDDQIKRLRVWTRVLVRRHLGKIEAVADALLASKSLSAADIDDIVAFARCRREPRSIDLDLASSIGSDRS